jgi:cytochrome c oxidase subunit III
VGITGFNPCNLTSRVKTRDTLKNKKMSTTTTSNKTNKIHPQKLALWMGCVSIVMLFAAWMSAYIVRQGQGNWNNYKMPDVFFISTGILILSSLTLHLSFNSFKRKQESAYKILLCTTFVLGIVFVVLQYQGWKEMATLGLPLGENAAGDFLYVISGFHAAHVLGGVATLITAMIHAFALPFKVTQRRIARYDLTLNYWHFMDLLWIVLFVFLLTQ